MSEYEKCIEAVQEGDYILAERLLTLALRKETEPESVAQLEFMMGLVRLRLGLGSEAADHMLKSLELRRAVLGESHAAVGLTLRILSQTLADFPGRESISVEISRSNLQFSTTLLGPDHPETQKALTGLIAALHRNGESHEELAQDHISTEPSSD